VSLIKHQKVSTIPNGGNPALIQPSDWNAVHIFDPASPGIIYDPLGDGNFASANALFEGQFLRRKYNAPAPIYEFATFISVNSADFNFNLTATGTLTAAAPSIIQLPITPKGVVSTLSVTSGHSIKIIDGSAGNEICLITSVDSVNHRITVTPTKNHASGNYTVTSATAGIQEAIYFVQPQGFGSVEVPAGNQNISATIINTGSGIKIRGTGRHSTFIVNDGALPNFDSFKFANGTTNELSGMTIMSTPDGTSGYGVICLNQSHLLFNDLNIRSANGMKLTNVSYSHIDKCAMINIAAGQFGIYVIGGLDITFDKIFMASNIGAPGAAAIVIDGGNALFFRTIDAIQFARGVVIVSDFQPSFYLWFDTVVMDTPSVNAWEIRASNNTISSIICINCWASTASSHGVYISGNVNPIKGIKWIGGRIVNNGIDGIRVEGNVQDTQISTSSITYNSRSSVGAGDDINILANVTKLSVHDCIIGEGDSANLLALQTVFGVAIAAAGTDYITITDNRFAGTFVNSPLNNASTGTHNIVGRNSGIDNMPPPVRTAAASLTLSPSGATTMKIIGSTPIANILGGSIGQRITLLFADPAPGGLGSGGNMARVQPAVANQKITLDYDGTVWY